MNTLDSLVFKTFMFSAKYSYSEINCSHYTAPSGLIYVTLYDLLLQILSQRIVLSICKYSRVHRSSF